MSLHAFHAATYFNLVAKFLYAKHAFWNFWPTSDSLWQVLHSFGTCYWPNLVLRPHVITSLSINPEMTSTEYIDNNLDRTLLSVNISSAAWNVNAAKLSIVASEPQMSVMASSLYRSFI